jgi:putative transposase
MARPLRIERTGGRYHLTARGNENKRIFRDDTDRLHLLELLSQLAERFGAKVHAYVLMDNHFHLLLETPEANLSRAMQWLMVSYSVWFNRRHSRVGHLFQGRFKAIIVQDDAGWKEVARYVHLNPVRVAIPGLGKRRQANLSAGFAPRPRPGQLGQRLQLLREYGWSSYRAYAGYSAASDWLCSEPLSRLCGGRSQSERRAALRQYTEQPVRQGVIEPVWGRLIARFVLGTEAFARSLLRKIGGSRFEQAWVRNPQQGVSWGQILTALERVKGEKWAKFSGRHGDWGRDAALWLGRRRGRLTLARLGALVGGIGYAAVGQAVSRFGKRMEADPALRRQLAKVQARLPKP